MSIGCSTVQDLFSLYHDEILSDETKREVEAHLAECPDCRKFYKDMESLYRKTADRHSNALQAEPAVDLDFANVAKKLRQARTRNLILAGAVAALFVAAGVLITNAVDQSKAPDSARRNAENRR